MADQAEQPMNRSRQGRANQRQTPLPEITVAQIQAHQDAMRAASALPNLADPQYAAAYGRLVGAEYRISSRNGRRAGLIPTAPIDPASNYLRSTPAMPERPSDATLLEATYICANCHVGPRPQHPLMRLGDGYVHAGRCPTKRNPPPPPDKPT